MYIHRVQTTSQTRAHWGIVYCPYSGHWKPAGGEAGQTTRRQTGGTHSGVNCTYSQLYIQRALITSQTGAYWDTQWAAYAAMGGLPPLGHWWHVLLWVAYHPWADDGSVDKITSARRLCAIWDQLSGIQKITKHNTLGLVRAPVSVAIIRLQLLYNETLVTSKQKPRQQTVTEQMIESPIAPTYLTSSLMVVPSCDLFANPLH